MNNLPFKNAGKVEVVEITDPCLGTLEFPKRYSVTLNEELEAIRILTSSNERSLPLMELEQRIKEATAKVTDLQNSGQAEESKAAAIALADLKIQQERRSLESQYETTVGLSTLALRRLTPDWSEEQTRELPRALIVAVSDYFLSERNGWRDADPVSVGKSQNGGNTPSKSKKLTAKSTGGSTAPSPATPDGTTTDSQIS